jgi:hypothetical protein
MEFSDEEIKSLIGVLKYALDYCPLEGISEEVNVTRDKVEDLTLKLEKILRS